MIMKVEELRIGNLLQPNNRHLAAYGENNAFVTSIYEDKFVVCNHYPGAWFEPMPITEEWLVRLGFKSEYTKVITNLGELEIIHSNGIIVFYLNKIEFNIKHIHSLQNLYFALTNEELTIIK